MASKSGKVYQNAEVAIIPLDEKEALKLYLIAKSGSKNPILVDMYLEFGRNQHVINNRYACVHIRNVIRQFGLGRITKLPVREKYFEIKEEHGIPSLFCKFIEKGCGERVFINHLEAQNMSLIWDQAMFGYSITHFFSVQKRLKVFSIAPDFHQEEWWTRDRGILSDEKQIPKLPVQVEECLKKVLNAEIRIE